MLQTSAIEAKQTQSSRVRLSAGSLEVAYDTTVALNIPKLDVSGRIIAILGHNGAGKSTLIKSILELLPPTHGSLQVELADSTSRYLLNPVDHMAFCPETGSVFTDISVESYVKLWCRIKHDNANYYKEEGAKFIDLLQITPLLPKFGRALSKGQRRRVQTAIGFLTDPKLFLFDEPFDGLDIQRSSELADLIYAHSHKMSFVLSSHRMDVVERLADKIIVLKDGRVASAGSVEAVCQELAGTTFLVSGATNPDSLAAALTLKFPNVLVNRIGMQIAVTSTKVGISELKGYLGQISQTDTQIEAISPRLTDAMNYHLAGLRSR